MPDDRPNMQALPTITRTECPRCGALCLEPETRCWQCGVPLNAPLPEIEPAPRPPSPADGLIQFEGSAAPLLPAAPAPALPEARPRVTLTGEVVEGADAASEEATGGEAGREAGPPGPGSPRHAATIGGEQIAAGPQEEVMVLSFCKACGLQNEEGVRECRKCKAPLEVVAVGSVKDLAPVPRAWGFDVLGASWIILGFAAIYCGQFLIKTDPYAHRATWADYFWTGVVACAPGFLIFMRHVFCKVLFWAMTLGSILVWSVICFIWLFIGLQVSDNGEVGLIWLALLSGLSVVSFLTVRLNDAFDFSF